MGLFLPGSPRFCEVSLKDRRSLCRLKRASPWAYTAELRNPREHPLSFAVGMPRVQYGTDPLSPSV
jgi:hypothetical protein